LGSTTTDSICSMSTESMYRSGSSHNLTTMQDSLRNKAFVPGVQWYAPPFDGESVASLDHDHVFVIVMGVCRRWCRLTTRPKGHLAPINAVEGIALHPWCRLTGCDNPVRWMFHEFWEIIHVQVFSHGCVNHPPDRTRDRHGCFQPQRSSDNRSR
jgi:hypothetical protein